MAALEYKVLHEDRNGAIAIQITKQDSINFDPFDDGKYRLVTRGYPQWMGTVGDKDGRRYMLCVRGVNRSRNDDVIIIPAPHAPDVQRLIRRFNEYQEELHRPIDLLEEGMILRGTCKDDDTKVDYFVITYLDPATQELGGGKMVRIKDQHDQRFGKTFRQTLVHGDEMYTSHKCYNFEILKGVTLKSIDKARLLKD
jgi:hypothetical protein